MCDSDNYIAVCVHGGGGAERGRDEEGGVERD